MTITFTREESEELLKQLFQNMPEYAQYTFRCLDYDYKKFVYKYYCVEEDETDDEFTAEEREKHPVKSIKDEETGTPIYTITLADAVKGFELFVKAICDKELFLDGLRNPMNLDDAGNYDVYAMDALLQLIIFGENIYG